jgi:hypothetical protein
VKGRYRGTGRMDEGEGMDGNQDPDPWFRDPDQDPGFYDQKLEKYIAGNLIAILLIKN